MTSTYNKPFLTIDEQIDRLMKRGLEIDSRQQASHHLRRIGYYRLSGYWYPFRQHAPAEGERRPSEFKSGTSLRTVLDVYEFDEKLRTTLMAAISRVEVDLRFRIGHSLGRHGPFAHCDADNLDPDWSTPQPRACSAPSCTAHCAWTSSDHQTWLERQKASESVSKEAFTAHIHDEYGEPLPVWVATEVMSFGVLARLLNGMKQRDRQQLAADLDIIDAQGNGDAATLSNWVEHLRQVRNACAHHARVWNKNFDAVIAVPQGVPEVAHLSATPADLQDATEPSAAVRRIYGTLAILSFLLARIDNDLSCRNTIRAEIEQFATDQPGRLNSMGFPPGWADQDLWQESYARDAERARHAELMRSIQMLTTKDAAALLTSKPTENKRRSRLNYYRKHGALLSVPWTVSHSYPAFQFDDTTGDVPQLVITANRRLLDGELGTDAQRWEALEWWVKPRKEVLEDASPVEALKAGTLTREVLDRMLPPRDDESTPEGNETASNQ